jgi:HAD superfamily hydrolase (TIGR01509 family)
LLHTLNLTDISLRLELVSLARTSSNWSRIRPGTLEVLDAIKKKCRLGAISNSDGHMAKRLAACGFAGFFEQIIDSAIVGHEKPSPEIFQAALMAMTVTARQALYVGDIYSVDYLGAQNVGMQAVLMDVAGVYASRNLSRIESLDELEAVLSRL